VTHAEWYAEVVDTYCWTLMLAQQLGAPVSHIPPEKAEDLLAIKQRLGLPDARLAADGCPVCDIPERPGAITTLPNSTAAPRALPAEKEAIIEAVTEAVLRALEERQRGRG
jgi:L-fuculose-phosphate aldolase